MKYVREIVSEGLKQRDQKNIPLKWPLSKVEVASKTKISKELKEIIMQELNVKKYSEKPYNSTELEINLDFNLTPELEAEGYAREISRNVQAFRKKLGLNKKNLINLTISGEKELKKILGSQIKLIKERTNSKIFEFKEKNENLRGETEGFKIKKFEIKIGVVKLNGSN